MEKIKFLIGLLLTMIVIQSSQAQSKLRNGALILTNSGDTIYMDPSGSSYSKWNPTKDTIYMGATQIVKFDSLYYDLVGGEGVTIGGRYNNVITVEPSGGDISVNFDGNRPILRVPTKGQNLGTSTIGGWLEWWYYSPASISSSISGTLFEIGTSQLITVSGSTSNPSGDVLSNGVLNELANGLGSMLTFSALTSYSYDFTFGPLQTPSGNFTEHTYSFRASQDYVGDESGTINSGTVVVNAIYPIFYGVNPIDFSTATGTTIYDNLTKSVVTEGNKNINFDGTGFAYFAIPKTWGDYNLSAIIDHNGFNVTNGFTQYDVTISSTGLTNNYSEVEYVIYKANSSSSYSNFTYILNR